METHTPRSQLESNNPTELASEDPFSGGEARVSGDSTGNAETGPPTGTGSWDLPFESILKWTGIVLVFLAVAFAMTVAVDRGWLTPELRVAGGIGLGAAMVGLGVRIHRRRPVFGQSVQGAGLAVLYLTFYASEQLLDVLPYTAAFTGMAVVTAAAFGFAYGQKDSALAVIGFLGGLVTPLVLGSDVQAGDGSARSLAVYLGVLIAATIAFYAKEGWGSLMAAGVVGGAAGSLVAIEQLGRSPSLEDQLVLQALVVMYAVGWWGVSVWRRVSQRPVTVSEHSIDRLLAPAFDFMALRVVLVLPPLALALSSGIWELTERSWGLVALGTAALVGSVGALLVRAIDRDLTMTHFVAASVLATVGLVLSLEGPVLFVAIAAQATALIVVAEWTDDVLLRLQGVLLGAVSLVVLAVRMASAWYNQEPVTAADAIADFLVIVFAAVAVPTFRDRDLRTALAVMVYVFVLGWPVEVFASVAEGEAAISAIWGITGAALVLGAATFRQGPLAAAPARRWAAGTGLATIAAVVAKLFLVDLAAVDIVWKIGLFFGLGVLLLALGYYFQTLWRRIESD